MKDIFVTDTVLRSREPVKFLVHVGECLSDKEVSDSNKTVSLLEGIIQRYGFKQLQPHDVQNTSTVLFLKAYFELSWNLDWQTKM